MKHNLVWICLGALILCFAGCDRREERIERANTLYQGVIVQLEASEEPGGLSALSRASMEERAILGALSIAPHTEMSVRNKQFAVGSIIAKPKQVADLRQIQAVPVPRAPSTQDRRSSKTTDNEIEAPEPVIETPVEIIAESSIMEAMIGAQSAAFEEMDKLGLDGSITLSTSGQMVIDMFAKASQFRPNEPTQPFLARDAETACPENVDRQTMQDNKVLATNCMVELLRKSGNFEYVEKDFIFEHQFARRPPSPETLFTPNDTLWSLQWHFQSTTNESGQATGGASFADFWVGEELIGSQAVTVAVVDTGLAMSHPDIAASANIAPGWDMVSDPAMGNDGDGRDNNPEDPGDLCDPNRPGATDSFHGTHVAGTIGAAASNNRTGVAGGAWGVTIVPVRALGKCGGRLSDINDAIRWAGGILPVENATGDLIYNENPADIINLSIGLFQSCPASMQDAINDVVARGALVVAAAGNARLSTEFYAPASCDNVIVAAAGDARGHIAPYSNFGPHIDVLAPGGDLDRDDNGDGHPDGVLSTRPADTCTDPLTGDTVERCYYAFEQGTSMAAPHVSAALALLSSKYTDMSGSELEALLLSSLSPRNGTACEASCALYPDATPIPGKNGICRRACGGLLNLNNLQDEQAVRERRPL